MISHYLLVRRLKNIIGRTAPTPHEARCDRIEIWARLHRPYDEGVLPRGSWRLAETGSNTFRKYISSSRCQSLTLRNRGKCLRFIWYDNNNLWLIQLFEGLKAYRGIDGRIRVFRPDMNMQRMNLSARASGLPTFQSEELSKCLMRLVSIDQEWVPHSEGASLYIRPTLIGIDVSCLYFYN